MDGIKSAFTATVVVVAGVIAKAKAWPFTSGLVVGCVVGAIVF